MSDEVDYAADHVDDRPEGDRRRYDVEGGEGGHDAAEGGAGAGAGAGGGNGGSGAQKQSKGQRRKQRDKQPGGREAAAGGGGAASSAAKRKRSRSREREQRSGGGGGGGGGGSSRGDRPWEPPTWFPPQLPVWPQRYVAAPYVPQHLQAAAPYGY